MKILFSTFSALALVAGLALIAAPEAAAQTQTSTSEFEFLKATEDRVWRLNRQTGEIAVCTLERETCCARQAAGRHKRLPQATRSLSSAKLQNSLRQKPKTRKNVSAP